MLEPLLCALDKKRIVLASASPRRKEILNMLGFRYDVVASSFEENLDKHAFTTPAEYCVRTAEGKARDVARVLQQKNEAVDLVIGADTIVVKGNSLYEKPKDSSDAERMLNECMTFHETTEVFMAPMSQEIIKAYVRTGEPLDKAGAYAIQGKGGSLVEKIVGDFYNVMGFPLHRFCKELGDLYAKLGNVK
ncbi:putative bifunctional dTTP/UTP pyrophosphatase/methyltransferase protein isoform X2 [Dermacentor variabilis]|uniref:putative bifunctional dTTP/UTP pyrophosphatase/methyltransferase protein isoform X2 n=1 Tax=Dermacentor variabilis TaxID=34621 RepID=UPI003F5BF9A3